MLPCTGWMIPGICFESGHCLWILNWEENPLAVKPLVEVWLFHPDGKRQCWVSDPRGVPFFETYHRFDSVSPAEIRLEREGDKIHLSVTEAGGPALRAEIGTGSSPRVLLVNLLLKLVPKAGERGKTETGKAYFNHPRRLRAVKAATAALRGSDLGKLVSPQSEIGVGDGKVPRKPVLNECTHWIEE